MVKVSALLFAGMVTVALVNPAAAAHRHPQHRYSETGPLIMSGSLVPAASPYRSRAPEICKPVVIKRRPMFSTVWR
jgi:hypothetical protein